MHFRPTSFRGSLPPAQALPLLFSSSALLLVLNLLFSRSVVSDLWRPHGLQLARLPCPSPSPQACSYSCPVSRFCHPTITSSAVPFSSYLQSSQNQGLLQ